LFTAKKIREYPINGGVTSCGVSTFESDLIELSTRLFRQLGWYGVAEVEFKVDPRDGIPKLIEINPRFWQYLQLPIACGINFPHLLYKTALDEEIEYVSTYTTGLKFINPLKDLLSVSSNLWKSHFTHNAVQAIVQSYRGEKTYSTYCWMGLDSIVRWR
jgi:D-aspartate ligase